MKQQLKKYVFEIKKHNIAIDKLNVKEEEALCRGLLVLKMPLQGAAKAANPNGKTSGASVTGGFPRENY